MHYVRAYQKTLHHEGGYSNHPNDRGGETYKGIARNYHPDWEGWQIIDSYKDLTTFPDMLDSIIYLTKLVQVFYKEKYWNPLWLDKFDSALIACEMFDTGVNMGLKRAGKFIQEALNILNRSEKNYRNLTVDGKIGSNTLRTLQEFLKYNTDTLLFNVLNILQAEHYLNIMRRDESQEIFARGWLKRVTVRKY